MTTINGYRQLYEADNHESYYSSSLASSNNQASLFSLHNTNLLSTNNRNNTFDLHPDLQRARDILQNGLCGCFSDIPSCIGATFCPCCLFGYNYLESNQGNGCVACLCSFILCAASRSYLQRYIGIHDSGIIANCFLCYFCGCCMIANDYRAIKAMKQYEKDVTPLPIQNTMNMA
jgi:Cys-rich protein (TIGR01571 family)